MNEETEQAIERREEINALLDKATPEQLERLYHFISMFIK